MSSPLPLLSALGWPEGADCGVLSWSRSDNDDRHGMTASLTLTGTGEIVMSSRSTFNERSQTRFNAHIPAGAETARVSMPGYEADKMSVAQAISLFRAHVDAMQVTPLFRRIGISAPRI